MKRLGSIVLIIVTLAACKGTDKMTSATDGRTVKKKAACGNMHIDMGQPHLDWYEENASVFNNAKEVVVLPKEYKVYSIDSVQLARFFTAINRNNTLSTVVPLPKPADCRIFDMRNNLAPNFKPQPNTGQAIGKSADQEMILIYTNGKIEGLIKWFELKYAINTVQANGRSYYIVYTKQRMESLPDQLDMSNMELIENKPVK
ncbi:MAG: hypothetical protein H6551_12450 [Chitinophagales bacterium]|nr:hypothetical protein [Chitinophagaceae bacterium]MCB9065941.1 hypothetical protein [Chitinophagales bacterium]